MEDGGWRTGDPTSAFTRDGRNDDSVVLFHLFIELDNNTVSPVEIPNTF
jgi:hypothetical protein